MTRPRKRCPESINEEPPLEEGEELRGGSSFNGRTGIHGYGIGRTATILSHLNLWMFYVMPR